MLLFIKKYDLNKAAIKYTIMDETSRTRGTDLVVDSFRSDETGYDRARMRRQSGGFVDLGNESQYGTGGHQASSANEIFADVQVFSRIES